MKKCIIATILLGVLHAVHIRCMGPRIAALHEIAGHQLKQHIIVPAIGSALELKGALDEAKEVQRQAILDPNIHNLGYAHLLRCKNELQTINDIVKRATASLSSADRLISLQNIEDKNLMEVVQGKFGAIAKKLDKIDNKMLHVPSNNGSLVAQASRQTALSKLRKKTLAVQLDLEKFFTVVNGETVQLDRPETLNVNRLLQHFYNKYSDGMPPVLIEWVHVACKWYNAWFAGNNPILVPALPDPARDRSDQPNVSVCTVRPAAVLGAIARIEDANTNFVVGGGGPTHLTQIVQNYRAGRGGVAQQLWNSVTTKMSNALKPSGSSSRIGAFVKRMIAGTVIGTARIAQWCVTKLFFKKGIFERKPWEERQAGQLCNGLARGWFVRTEEVPLQEPQLPWWRRWFGLRGR